MKLGNDFKFDSVCGRYDIIYCEASDHILYDGGIIYTSDKKGIINMFFKKRGDKLKLFNMNGFDRSLNNLPNSLVEDILKHYN